MSIPSISANPTSLTELAKERALPRQRITWISEKYRSLSLNVLDQICLTMHEKIDAFFKEHTAKMERLKNNKGKLLQNIQAIEKTPWNIHHVLCPYRCPIQKESSEESALDYIEPLNQLIAKIQVSPTNRQENQEKLQCFTEVIQSLKEHRKSRSLNTEERHLLFSRIREFEEKQTLYALLHSYGALTDEIIQGINIVKEEWTPNTTILSKLPIKTVQPTIKALVLLHAHLREFYLDWMKTLSICDDDAESFKVWSTEIETHSQISQKEFLTTIKDKKNLDLFIFQYFQTLSSFCLIFSKSCSIPFRNPETKFFLIAFQQQMLYSMLILSDALGALQRFRKVLMPFEDFLDYATFLVESILTISEHHSQNAPTAPLTTWLQEQVDFFQDPRVLRDWVELSANINKLFLQFAPALEHIQTCIKDPDTASQAHYLTYLDLILQLLEISTSLCSKTKEENLERIKQLVATQKTLNDTLENLVSQQKDSDAPSKEISSFQHLSLSEGPSKSFAPALDEAKIKTFKDFTKILAALGYKHHHTTGSHQIWKKEKAECISVPGAHQLNNKMYKTRYSYLFTHLQNAFASCNINKLSESSQKCLTSYLVTS